MGETYEGDTDSKSTAKTSQTTDRLDFTKGNHFDQHYMKAI